LVDTHILVNRLVKPVHKSRIDASIKRLRFPAILLSIVIMIGSYLILLATFLSAYLSPIKTVIVHINNIGEANIELVFLLASVPCVLYYLTQLRWSKRKEMMWVKVDE